MLHKYLLNELIPGRASEKTSYKWHVARLVRTLQDSLGSRVLVDI